MVRFYQMGVRQRNFFLVVVGGGGGEGGGRERLGKSLMGNHGAFFLCGWRLCLGVFGVLVALRCALRSVFGL